MINWNDAPEWAKYAVEGNIANDWYQYKPGIGPDGHYNPLKGLYSMSGNTGKLQERPHD